MSVTFDDALTHLHIEEPTGLEATNLDLYVEAANQWVGAKVADTIPEYVLQLATLLLIQHWWERSQLQQVNTLVDEQYVDIEGRTYAIPSGVRELIEGFLLTSVRPAPVSSFPDAAAWPDPVEWTV